MRSPSPSRRATHPPAVALRTRVAAVVLALVAALGGGALVAPSADAGTFVHRYCNGTTTQQGWSSYATGPGTYSNECALQGRLVAADGSNTSWGPGSTASITWTAPDNTTITQWSPDIRYGYSRFNPEMGSGDIVLRVGDDGGSPFYACKNAECASPITGPVSVYAGAKKVEARITCTANSAAQNCRAGASLLDNGGTVTLEDLNNPTGGAATGTVVAASSPDKPLVGGGTIAMGVDDLGSGVSAVGFVVDGKTVQTQENPGCQPQPSFQKVPCPLHQDALLTVDSRQLSDGAHSYELVGRDAASNFTSLAKGQFYVANSQIGPGSPEVIRGALTSDGATDTAKVTATFPSTAYRAPKACRSKTYKRRHKSRCTNRSAKSVFKGAWSTGSVTLTGRVTNVNTKNGIGGAPVRVTGVVARGTGAPIDLSTTTNGTGRWTVKVPRSANGRKISVAYYSHARDAVPVARASASTVIRAKSSFSVSRRSVRPGGRVRFTGALADKTDGVPVNLEVRYRGKWRTFDTSQTGGGGKFSASYRFTRKGGRGTYRFRARVRPTSGTNYANVAGYSPSRVVRVR